MYRFDRAKGAKMQFVFFGSPLYLTLEKPKTFFAIRKMCSTQLLVFESRRFASLRESWTLAGDEAMDPLALPVHSYVNFFLLSLFRGVYIGIPLFPPTHFALGDSVRSSLSGRCSEHTSGMRFAVLRGGRGVDDGGRPMMVPSESLSTFSSRWALTP